MGSSPGAACSTTMPEGKHAHGKMRILFQTTTVADVDGAGTGLVPHRVHASAYHIAGADWAHSIDAVSLGELTEDCGVKAPDRR